ncbi:MAG: 8-amino-7-oxononanoate synthase [Candidatus Melainabacteria bacterium]|nr:8-amino-7-oxononanoate synthase [Candidatus Melainabacteria bacterium]
MNTEEALQSYVFRLTELKGTHQYRHLRPWSDEAAPSEGPHSFGFPHCRVDEQPLVNFCSNNYLGLAQHPHLIAASIRATQQYGTGSGASQLICGYYPLLRQLALAVCQWKATEAALVFSSGYQANVSILQALLLPEDWVFFDRLNHASLYDGCLMSKAKLIRYPHRDMEALAKRLAGAPSGVNKWIVTDSLFSMDGSMADLHKLSEIAHAHGALVLVDEAHASGLYGEKRRSGLVEHFQAGQGITLQMGTFSKALGGQGAYVAGPQVLIDWLINRARGFIYTTAPPPGTVAAALAAIEWVQENSDLHQRLWRNVKHLQAQLASGHSTQRAEPNSPWASPTNSGCALPSPIIPWLCGSSEKALEASKLLMEQGFWVQAIRPPTVPPGTARLRICLSAAHSEEQISQLSDALLSLDL